MSHAFIILFACLDFWPQGTELRVFEGVSADCQLWFKGTALMESPKDSDLFSFGEIDHVLAYGRQLLL